MAMPQPGAFSLGTRQHFHLEFKRLTDEQSLFDAIRCVRDNADTVAGVNVVVGFGPQLLADLFPRDVPKGFESFRPIAGTDGFMIPGGQHDLWIWLHGSGQDIVLDTARSVARELDGVADLVTEQQSFAYGSSQDLTGFEDGTENLSLDDALSSATVSGSGPAAGGSVVLLQRWVHDLAAFNALDVDERERVIGRTLADSTELTESQQPTNSHVSRVVIEDEEGDELGIFRRSTAFGGVREHGLMFVAFSADIARLQRMLKRMAGAEDGVRDRLTKYSSPQSSGWYFTPPVDLIRRR